MAAAQVADGYARAGDDGTHAWSPDPGSRGPHWIELSWDEPATFNVLHLSFQKTELAPARFSVEVWQDGGWRTVAQVDDNRHRRHVLGLDRVTTDRLRVIEAQPAGIVEVRVYDEPEQQVEIARRAHATMRRPDVGPFLPWDGAR